MGTIEFELSAPIMIDGESTSTLSLRPLKIGDLRAGFKLKDSVEQTLFFIQKSANITPKEVDSILAKDFTKLSEVVGESFL